MYWVTVRQKTKEKNKKIGIPFLLPFVLLSFHSSEAKHKTQNRE